VNGLELGSLALQALVVLAVLVGDGAKFLGRLRGQFAVGRRVSEGNFLAGVHADLALEQDKILLEGVLGGDESLLLGLKLDPRPQLVQVSRGSGLMGFVRVVEQQLAFRFQSFGVVNFAGGGKGVQIGRSHLLHHFVARGHSGEIGSAFRRSGRLPCGNHRKGKKHLAVVNLALGHFVAGNSRNSAKPELLHDAGAEAFRNQIQLVNAGIAGKRDGGQKILQGLVLLPLARFLAIFSFLQAQVVLEAETDGVIQRELQNLIGGWARGHAAKESVGGRSRVGSLGRNPRRRGREGQDREKRRQDSPPGKRLFHSIHFYYFLR
jgi:hypothetical protein